MRVATLFKTMLAVGAPVAMLTGCDLLTGSSPTPATDGTDWESTTNLVSEYGGYEFTDESSAFADPEVSKIEIEENAVAVADSDSVPSYDSFAVRILWGQLEGDRDAQEIKDWDGSFSVSSGGLAVLRTIAFERPTDRLLPRDSRQVVPFASKTRPHFDGLLLLIHAQQATDGMLTMETASYSNSWSFEELRGADLVLSVDDMGNAVSVTGVDLPDDPACAGGMVRGHWVTREGERGVFRGVWKSALGRSVGYIRGHFGVNDEGQKVWFAKIIERNGRLIGLARGTYAPSDNSERPGGSFTGHWAVRGSDRTGAIAGHYVPAREAGDRAGGFFHARWKTDCNADQEREISNDS